MLYPGDIKKKGYAKFLGGKTRCIIRDVQMENPIKTSGRK